MNSASISTIGQIANQADFIGHFGAFLNYQAGVGFLPHGLDGRGRIAFKSSDREMGRLDPLIRIDGSPRSKLVGGVMIPDLQERERDENASQFVRDIYMLQKSIDVPLRALMGGVQPREFESDTSRMAFQWRIGTYGEQTTRGLLECLRGREDERVVLGQIGTDVFDSAERILKSHDKYVANAYLFNAAALLATSDFREDHRIVAEVFDTLSETLSDLGRSIGSAVVAELAAEMTERHEDVESEGSLGNRVKAARAWTRSLDEDADRETYPIRLLRGLANAWREPGKSATEGLLLRACDFYRDNEPFDAIEVAAYQMRLAWAMAHRDAIGGEGWLAVSDAIEGAIVYWSSGAHAASFIEELEVAHEFAHGAREMANRT